MTYRIIITRNNKKKKILHKSNNISSIKKKYFQIKDKNKVLYPKQTSSYLKTKPIKYELILCNCPLDSEKLYGVLKKFAENNNINNILFTGDIKLDKTEIYNMIANKTGWDKNKVYRTVTRP